MTGEAIRPRGHFLDVADSAPHFHTQLRRGPWCHLSKNVVGIRSDGNLYIHSPAPHPGWIHNMGAESVTSHQSLWLKKYASSDKIYSQNEAILDSASLMAICDSQPCPHDLLAIKIKPEWNIRTELGFNNRSNRSRRTSLSRRLKVLFNEYSSPSDYKWHSVLCREFTGKDSPQLLLFLSLCFS